jgi:hypothetical protein
MLIHLAFLKKEKEKKRKQWENNGPTCTLDSLVFVNKLINRKYNTCLRKLILC